jgi:hypothetical protein
VYQPSLGLTNMSPQPDPNPDFTARFAKLLQGDEKSIPYATELTLTLNSERGKWFVKTLPSYKTVGNLAFIHRETQPDGDRTVYYKTTWNGQTTYAAITMNKADQTVGYGLFSLP